MRKREDAAHLWTSSGWIDGVKSGRGVHWWLPVVLGLNILASDPGTRLSVHVDPWGWASALAIEQIIRRRLVDHLDTVSAEVMEQVDAALRAALDL